MSSGEVEVVRVEVEKHPDADLLEIAKVGDFLSVIQKGSFKTGDLAAYIPEGSIVPEKILEDIGLKGKLSGTKKNRVRAMRLRGVLSQGILYPAKKDWLVGDDVTNELGIEKYEPPIPMEMNGKVLGGTYSRWCFKYDFENIKRRPGVIEIGESVSYTEKLHGTLLVIGMLPEREQAAYGLPSRFFASSKGLFGRGITLDLSAVATSVYQRVIEDLNLPERLYRAFGDAEYPLYLLGEVLGVQDIKYGLQGGKLEFRVFDMARKSPSGSVDFADDDVLEMALQDMGLNRVPVLYKGPFCRDSMIHYTCGDETVSGGYLHVREGIVVRPLTERVHPRYGRVIFKSINEDYLLRKNGTEFN